MDAYYNQLALQMSFNGANNSTSFVDYSPNEHALSASGAPIISTAQSKAGGSSLYVDGSSKLGVASSAAFAFGANSFVIQLWIYPVTNSNSYPTLLGKNLVGSWTANDFSINVNHASVPDKYSVWCHNYSSVGALLSSTSTVTYNDWTHLAVVRTGTTIRLFVNGTQEATVTTAVNLNDATVSTIYIGDGYKGYIENLSITNGSDRGMTSNFTPSSTIDTEHIWSSSATDSIAMSESTSTVSALIGSASELFYLSSVLDSAWSKFIADGISLSASSSSSAVVSRSITEGMTLAGVVSVKGAYSASAVDAMALAASAACNARLLAGATDGIKLFEAELQDGNLDDLLQVWVANLATSAHSRYVQYGFNSFCSFEGKYYGCKSDGIYELTGDLDGSSAIPWTVTLPEMDFGTSNLKRFESVYVGAKSTGQLVLKVVQDKDSIYHYNVVQSGNEGRMARAVMGRGAVGRYWQLELASDTERAELDSIDFSISVLSRRI